MNSGSFSGVVADASMVSETSKVLGSNWRVATLTLSCSCGCFCSIRLCGARGFSKLRSLMYWPWMVSGLGACCGCGLGPPGGGVDMACFLPEAGRYHARLPCTSRARAATARQLPRNARGATIKRHEIEAVTPPDRRVGLSQGQRPQLGPFGGRQVCA